MFVAWRQRRSGLLGADVRRVRHRPCGYSVRLAVFGAIGFEASQRRWRYGDGSLPGILRAVMARNADPDGDADPPTPTAG